MELNNWELIQLKQITNVRWLSGPKGQMPDPNGQWIVVGFVKSDVVAAKEGTLIRIPVEDVRRVGIYSIDHVMEQLAKAGKTTNEIDMVTAIADYLEWDHFKAKSFLQRYGLPLQATNDIQMAKIIEKVQQLAEGEE